MIYYWSPDYTSAVGGVKILYRHVDILNSNGYNASIIHKKSGFRCSWFENDTEVSYLKKISLDKNDFLVIPEIYGSLYTNPKSRPKAYSNFKRLFESNAIKIVFNQGVYNTFNGQTFYEERLNSIYQDPVIKGVMVVSDDSLDYLKYSFPGLNVVRFHNSINRDVFFYNPHKKKKICFMPSKNADHAVQVICMLKSRGITEDFEIIPIENKSEYEVAQIMKESLIFLSFGYPAGFSLPPAEAMACGCIVVGYHGMGGREYFKSDLCFPVEMGDIIAFSKMTERVIEEWEKMPGAFMERTMKASAYIHSKYTKEREEQDVLDFWKSMTETQAGSWSVNPPSRSLLKIFK